MKVHYAVLHSELTGEVSKELEESEKHKYAEEVHKLIKSIENMEKEVQLLKEKHETRMGIAKKQYTDVVAKLQNITFKLMKSEDCRCVFQSGVLWSSITATVIVVYLKIKI